MVYKKYSYKQGKRYGPYLYENKRVGEKIVTNYLGKGESSSNNGLSTSNFSVGSGNFWALIFVFIFLLVSSYAFLSVNHLISTGRVTADVESLSYKPGENLAGTVKFNIREGELIPQDAKVVIRNGVQSQTLYLSDVSIRPNLISGDFYAENSSLSGSGDGYGVLGKRVTKPKLDFQLLITKSSEVLPSTEEVNLSGETNETIPLVDEGVVEVNTNENVSSGSVSENETGSEVTPQNENQSGNEEQTPSSEQTTPENVPQTGTTEPVSGNLPSETGSPTQSESGTSETTESGGSGGDSSSGGDTGGDSGGNSGDSSGDSGGDSGGGITGSAIIEDAYTIDGSVLSGGEFDYNLEPGQTVEIIKGSVRINGEEVGDDKIKLSVSGDKIKVSSDYEIVETGFGKQYLGDYAMVLKLDLAVAGLRVEDSDVNVELSYNGVHIASADREIKVVGNASLEVENTILSLLNDIPQLRISKDGVTSLNLNEFFYGASSYTFVGANITAEFSDDVLNLMADEGFKGLRKAKIIAYRGSQSVESNEFNILVSSGAINIKTTRAQIKVGEDVKWTQKVSLDSPEAVTVEIPLVAEDIVIKTVENNVEQPASNSVVATGNVVIEVDLGKEPKIMTWIKKVFKAITGRAVDDSSFGETKDVILNDDVEEYTIEYTTPAPTAVEIDTSTGKEVVVSAPDELNYTDVLAFSDIPEMYSVGEEGRIKIYWVESRKYLPFDAYDMDGDDRLDYVEWVVPHLSDQTFNIILITKAELLDSNKEFIQDIYDKVKARDSNTIIAGDSDYIRVLFEKNLTSINDITFYARAVSGISTVEVYEKNGNTLLATFENISSDSIKKYRILLSALSGQQDTFDLLIHGATEFDYIVDPTGYCADDTTTCSGNANNPSGCTSAGCTSTDTSYCSGNYCDIYGFLGACEGAYCYDVTPESGCGNYDNSVDCGNDANCAWESCSYGSGDCGNGNSCSWNSGVNWGCLSGGSCVGMDQLQCGNTIGCTWTSESSCVDDGGCGGITNQGSCESYGHCTWTAYSCSGGCNEPNGACVGTDTCECYNGYSGTNCQNSCTTNDACLGYGGYCNTNAGACTDGSDGQGCAFGTECASGICTDNVCTSCGNALCDNGETCTTCFADCDDSAACVLTEQCDGAEDCVSGACSGGVCVCDGNGDCSEPTPYCNTYAGACTDGSDGQGCGADGECSSGNCESNVCVPACWDTSDCGIGVSCSSDGQCSSTQCGDGGHCTSGANTEECYDSGTCALGNICSGGVCVADGDVTPPTGDLSGPSNGGSSSSSSNNFTGVFSDAGGLANATLYIYNVANELINQTTVALDGAVEATVGIVVSLADGVYTWFYGVFDMAGNYFATGNWTLTVDNRSLVGWWKGDNNANDSSGNGNNGTLNGDVTYTAGKIGNAFSFDGDGDYVDVAGLNNYLLGENISISVWFKLDNLTGEKRLVSQQGDSGCGGHSYYVFAVMDGYLTFSLDNASNTPSATLLSTDVWYHAVAVKSGSNVVVYLNGTPESLYNDAGTCLQIDENLIIGAYVGGGAPSIFFDGSMDDVRVYNYALNESEVLALYNNVTSQSYNLTDGLVGYWKLNETSGDALDYSGYGNNGTLNGGVTQNVAGPSNTLNNAYEFNGGDSYITVSAPASLDDITMQPYTVSLWMNPNNWDNYISDLVGWACPTENFPGFGIEWNENEGYGTNGVYLWHGQWTYGIPAENQPPLGQWSNYIAVFNGSALIIYINGTQSGNSVSASATGSCTSQDLKIGLHSFSSEPQRHYNGSIADVAVWNRSLNSSEVEQIYNGGEGRDLSVVGAGNAAPLINFTSPTPANGATVNVSYFNVSLNSSDNNREHYAFLNFDNSLVGWWRGENNANDALGVNNGTWSGTETYATGKFGNAFDFNAGGNCVDTGSTTLIGNDSDFTISGWMKVTSCGDNACNIIAGKEGDTITDIQFFLSGETLGSIGIWGGGGGNGHSIISVPHGVEDVGAWHHYVWEREGNVWSVYADGVAVGNVTDEASLGAATQTYKIGSYGDCAQQLLDGFIDDVLIFNRSLSADEIRSLYNATANQYNNNFTNLSNGAHTIKGYAVDSSGNVNNTETRTITINTANRLVGWWKGDNNANDSSGNGNNGTLNGDTTYTTGKIGQAFSFDGNGDYVSTPLVYSYPQITLGAWINPTVSANTQWIVGDWEAGGTGSSAALDYDEVDSDKIRFSIMVGGTEYSLRSNALLSLDTWYHVFGVYNGTDMVLYIDGSLDNNTSVSGSLDAASAVMRIGGMCNGCGTNYFAGKIDDVHIYSYALNASEILALYNNASDITAPAINFTSPTPANGATVTNSYFNVSMTTSDNNAEHYAFLNFDNSLVGWWKGEDNANDTLGINNGTFNGDANASVTGRFGNAFGFDGDGDYVSIPYSSSLNITNVATFSVWVKPAYTDYGGTPTAAFICGHGGWSNRGWSLGAAHGDWQNVRFHWQPGIDNPAYILDTTSNPLSTGVWTHVVGVANGTYVKIYINGQFAVEKPNSEGVDYDYPIEIGRCGMSSPDSYFNGSIDEVLIFNRSLSASEVASLYNATANQYNNNFTNLNNGNYIIKGYAVDTSGNVNNTETRTITINIANRLVGWWKGDGDATDSSGFGNNGTWSGTENYTTGRIGQAMSFDGASRVIAPGFAFGQPNFTASAWVYMLDPSNCTGLNNFCNIITFENEPSSSDYSFEMAIDSSRRFWYAINNTNPGWAKTDTDYYLPNNEWHLMTFTYNGSDINIYADGLNVYNYSSASGNIQDYTNRNLFIGGRSEVATYAYWKGRIDDVRIYNYALNESEVLALYHNATGLIGWWKGDGDATDSSGFGNNGTWSGTENYTTGRIGQAFHLDGSGYVNMSIDSYPTGDRLSSEFLWFRTTSNNPWLALFNHGPLSQGNRRAMAINATPYGSIYFGGYYDDLYVSEEYTAEMNYSDGNWHFIGYVYRGSGDIDIYFDGVSYPHSSLGLMSLNTLAGDHFLGRMPDGGDTNNFTGDIDDYRIYNYALNGSEVLALYNNVSDTTAPLINFTSPTPSDGETINASYFNVSLNTSDNNYDHYAFLNFDNSLVGWWRAENNANDSLGINNGTWNGTESYASGKFGNAFSFDGVDDNAETISNVPISGSQPRAISAWIYASILPSGVYPSDYAVPFSIGSATHNSIFEVQLGPSGDFHWHIWDTYPTVATLNSSHWYYVVLDYNGTDIKAYIDGELVDSSTQTIDTTLTPLYIGRSQIGVRHWNGSVDDIIIFNRSLSADEVRSLYNATANQYDNNFTGLANGAHTIKGYAVDTSGNVNNTEIRTINVSIVVDTTAPLINFTSPTPSDGETINASYFNVSLNTSDNNYDHYAFLNFDNSLKGWWRGENNTGDDSGNENNGTLNGGTTYISGKFGNAFSFDDSDDYISVNSAGDLPDGNNQFTFSLWAYPESFVTGTALSLAEDGSGTNRMALGFTGNGASGTWNYYDPALAEWVPSASGAVMIDTWQMVTITFDGTTDRYYINGSEIGSRVASHTFNSSYTFIGTDNQGDPFNGSIDDVLIFNRSLSASEVASLYNATANQYNNNFTNLSNGAHTIKGYAVDSSGNVNNTETRTITVNVTFVNLTINSVTTSPLNPKDIQNISVIVNVSSDVTGGGVTCNLTGELGEYQGNASAGINKNVTFRIGTQTVGDHYYNVSCSSSGETADSLNNLVYVANTPNLYISNVTFSASNPSPGQPIIVYAMVGSYYASSENLVVAFYEDGVNIENTTISSISADSLAETFIYKTFSSDGNHIISVEVNPASSIVETNYTDNSFTKGISVGDAAYGDISVNLTLTPNPVNYSSTFSVNGSVIYDFSPYVSVKSGVVILVYQGDGVNANRTYSTTTNENGVFSFTGLLANNTAGNYIVTVTVSDGTFVGTDTTTITIAPSAISPYPDLMFDGSSDITFNDSVAVINESIRITANVKNRGGANSSAVVHFYDGNIFIGESNITNVVNGSSATASVNYTFDSYGTHSVKAAVDPQNFVQEASETNNNITRTMRVYYNASDLDPYRITTSEDSPLVGQSVSLTAYVYNIEGVIATNIPVNFYANGVLIGQNNISYINPAYNVGTTNISYAFASSGVYNITVAVNEQQTLSESSYSNNNHTSNSLVTAYDSYTNDLFVNDLYTNNTFADGTANLIASVKNLDNGNISDVIVVDFYVNGTFVGAANTTGLNSGQTKNISLPYSFSKNYLGTINFTAIANQERSITETSYANNNRSELFRVYMPDLRVLGPDIIFSQNGVNVEGATLGTDVTINVTITNLNNSDAKNVNIVINSTGGFSDNILVNVSALSSATVSTTWNSISPVGSAVVSVYANSNYSSFEARTSNNYATRSLNVFGSAPQIELLGAPNEDQVVSGSFEVDVSQTNATNIVYTLYYENGTQVNSATYDSSETNHTFNLTGLANGNYSYIANATVFGAYNATGLRNITVIGSCLSQCTEGNSCTISEDCMLNDNICSDNTCEFENLTLSAKIYTLYDSSGNGKNLTLNLTSNETGSSIMFLPGNSIIFSGRAGTDLGVGSAAGSAGILNITVYDLFNTTRAMFIGQGGYTTSADAAGGNGGQVQLNYHGLIRKFTDATGFYLCGLDEWGDPAYCPDNTPSLTRGSAIVGLAGNAGNISYVKSLDCNPERDSDADNDGVVFASDLFDLSYYNAVNGSAYYSQAYDIACKNKLNVVAMSRVGLEYDRGRI